MEATGRLRPAGSEGREGQGEWRHFRGGENTPGGNFLSSLYPILNKLLFQISRGHMLCMRAHHPSPWRYSISLCRLGDIAARRSVESDEGKHTCIKKAALTTLPRMRRARRVCLFHHHHLQGMFCTHLYQFNRPRRAPLGEHYLMLRTPLEIINI